MVELDDTASGPAGDLVEQWRKEADLPLARTMAAQCVTEVRFLGMVKNHLLNDGGRSHQAGLHGEIAAEFVDCWLHPPPEFGSLGMMPVPVPRMRQTIGGRPAWRVFTSCQ